LFIQQIYTGCLAQGAYYVESAGQVAIIDPLREVQSYIDMAKERGALIKYVFETHFHADFVSGHLRLSEKTGAPIIYGPNAETKFKSYIAKDLDEFALGKIKIRAIHTPGHTMESTSYLIIDEEGKQHALFSGDSLFLGDVGRPDLSQKIGEISEKDLAGFLFDSLRNKIMTLPDETIVYPAHGAGSACGKKMSSETIGTIGEQKKINYALRADMTKEEFIKEFTDGLLPPPAYFPSNVKMNQEGYQNIDVVLNKGMKGLSPDDFESMANKMNALVLDVRSANDFGQKHIPNSIFIGLDGGFAPWVGTLIKHLETPILLVVDEGKEEEAITRLSRVGFDNVLGYLNGGISAWSSASKDLDFVNEVNAKELINQISERQVPVVDVRKEGEFATSHLRIAVNLPLSDLNKDLVLFDRNEDVYVHCAGGYRSMIAISILKSRGRHNVVNIEGGYGSLQRAAETV
jgi:hydroxyacylglutathione hydrolase